MKIMLDVLPFSKTGKRYTYDLFRRFAPFLTGSVLKIKKNRQRGIRSKTCSISRRKTRFRSSTILYLVVVYQRHYRIFWDI